MSWVIRRPSETPIVGEWEYMQMVSFGKIEMSIAQLPPYPIFGWTNVLGCASRFQNLEDAAAMALISNRSCGVLEVV